MQGPQRHPGPPHANGCTGSAERADYTYYTLPSQERGALSTAAELAAALEPFVEPASAEEPQERPD